MTSYIEIYSATLSCIKEIDSIVKSTNCNNSYKPNQSGSKSFNSDQIFIEDLKKKWCTQSSKTEMESNVDFKMGKSTISSSFKMRNSNILEQINLKYGFELFCSNKINLKFNRLHFINISDSKCLLDDYPKQIFNMYQLTPIFSINMFDLLTLLDYLFKAYYFKSKKAVKKDYFKIDLSLPINNMSLNTTESLYKPIYVKNCLNSLSNISIDKNFFDESCANLIKNLNLNVRVNKISPKTKVKLKRLKTSFVKFNSLDKICVYDSIPSYQFNIKVTSDTGSNLNENLVKNSQIISEGIPEFEPTQPFEIENFDILSSTQHISEEKNTIFATELEFEKENTQEYQFDYEPNKKNMDKQMIPTQIITQKEEHTNKPIEKEEKKAKKVNKNPNKLPFRQFMDFIPLNSNDNECKGKIAFDPSMNMTQCGTILYEEKLRKHLDFLNKSDLALDLSASQINQIDVNTFKKAVKRKIFMNVGLSKKQKVKSLLSK